MKKLVKGLLFILLVLSVLITFANLWIHFAYTDSIASNTLSLPVSQAALVLGASVTANKEPSFILRQRLEKALELYNSGKIKKIILSGDSTDKYYDEVNAMKNFMLENHVTAEDIFLDHNGIRTYDSVYRCKYIFKAQKIIIVTQRFHLPRSLFMAEKIGIQAKGLAADEKEIHSDKFLMLREIFARSLAVIDIYFLHREPKFLGKQYNIQGDGRKTWN